jgi:hypothetical protein
MIIKILYILVLAIVLGIFESFAKKQIVNTRYQKIAIKIINMAYGALLVAILYIW